MTSYSRALIDGRFHSYLSTFRQFSDLVNVRQSLWNSFCKVFGGFSRQPHIIEIGSKLWQVLNGIESSINGRMIAINKLLLIGSNLPPNLGLVLLQKLGHRFCEILTELRGPRSLVHVVSDFRVADQYRGLIR